MEQPGQGGIAIGGDLKGSAAIIGDGNTVDVHYTEHHYHSAPAPSAARRIPPVLPYLVDRVRQTRAIEDALQAAVPNRSTPLLFVLFGDKKQSHDMLLRRIHENILPDLLPGSASQAGISRIDVPWPEDVESPSELPDELLRCLSDTLRDRETGRRLNSSDEVNEVLRRFPGPVMLTWQILDVDWKCFGPECLSSFLEFWNGWPELAGRQRVLLFLSVKYTVPDSTESNFLHRLLYSWLGWSQKATHEEMENVLKEHCEKAWDRIAVRLLDKLDDINESEAMNWARSSHVRAFGAIGDQLVSEIGNLFRQWEADHHRNCIPMDELAAQLITLLRNDSFVNC